MKHLWKCAHGLPRAVGKTALGSHCGQPVVKTTVLGSWSVSFEGEGAAIESFVTVRMEPLVGFPGSAH